MNLDRVLETCLYVDDLPAAEAFYRDVLGLSLHAREPGRHLFFKLAAGMLLIFDPKVTLIPSGAYQAPMHGATGPGHVAFAVKEDELDELRAELQRKGVIIETEVQWPQGGRSIYFRDPAGNSLELATPRMWELA